MREVFSDKRESTYRASCKHLNDPSKPPIESRGLTCAGRARRTSRPSSTMPSIEGKVLHGPEYIFRYESLSRVAFVQIRTHSWVNIERY